MFYAIDIEDRIRADHPLRPIRKVVDEILRELSPLLSRCYSEVGRPSVAPEVLLKALLLQCLYSVRSERHLVERLDTDLLFRWFCGLDPAEDVFDATAFTHNRPRLDDHGVTGAFFSAVRARAMNAGLTSDEHFSVDGALIESRASIKSFRANDRKHGDKDDSNSFKPRNPDVDFHNAKFSSRTHSSATDPEACLYRKSWGQEAKLCHMGHVVAENRNGLVMSVAVTEANGRAECAAALAMLDEMRAADICPRTLGADRGFDSGPFMIELERREVVPHVAMRAGKVGGAKGTTARLRRKQAGIAARRRMKKLAKSAGYRLSQRARKKVEEAFAWTKTIAGLARARHVGRWKIRQCMELAAAAFNLVRMRNLLAT